MSGPVDTTEDPPAGEIVTFVRPERRTYLDAAREQGVYQEREELLDEIATYKAKGYGNAPSATVTPIGGEGSAQATFANAVDQAQTDTIARLRQIVDAFEASGLPASWVPFMKAIMFESELPGTAAAGIFDAAQHDIERQSAVPPAASTVAANANSGEACR